MTPSITLLAFIWRHLRTQGWRFALIAFLSLIWAIDATVWPYLFGKITDILTQHDATRQGAWSSLRPLLITAVGLWTAIELCFRSRGFFSGKSLPETGSRYPDGDV